MNEVKKCPKCGEEMEMGNDLSPVPFHYVSSIHLRKTDDWICDKIVPFCCKKCGCIEL